jgi:ribosome-associated protein
MDGAWPTSWMVLDYLDVMVHVMRSETRARYTLEDLWGDALRIKPGGAPRARTPRTVKAKKS